MSGPTLRAPLRAATALLCLGAGAAALLLLLRVGGGATDLLADQYLGGSLTWALGELPMVLLLVVLLAQWHRSDSREARRLDRRADRDHDAALVAYNASLSRLAEADRAEADRHGSGAPGTTSVAMNWTRSVRRVGRRGGRARPGLTTVLPGCAGRVRCAVRTCA